MHPILRNILAVIAGIFLGSIVNMGIIMIGGSIIPLPPGVDPSDPESLKAAMETMEFKHFIMPLLAHAGGTLVGAMVAGLIAATRRRVFALVMGFWFLLGGIGNIFMIGGPQWFYAIDLPLAYLPMAWIGWKIAELIRPLPGPQEKGPEA